MGLVVAGCLGGAPSVDEPSVELPQESQVVGRAFSWHFENGSTYYSVGIEVINETDFEIEFSETARWTDRRGWFIVHNIIREVSPHTLLSASGAAERGNGCPDLSGPDPDNCEQQTHSDGGVATTLSGKWKPGHIIVMGAAFGADEAVLRVNLTVDQSIRIHWIESGNSSLLVLENDHVAPAVPQGGPFFSAAAFVDADRPIFAVFTTSGASVEGPDYWADNPQEEDYYFERQEGELYQDQDGNLVGLPAFAAPGGTWGFVAQGGLRWVGRAAIHMVGLVEGPTFVGEDGRIILGERGMSN